MLSRIHHLAVKEIRHVLNSYLGYVFAIVFIVALPYPMFWFNSKTNIFLNLQTDLRVFFNFLPMMFMVFIPALSMRSWSEERRSGTIETLLCYPLKAHELVIGKFAGNLLVIWGSLLMTFTIPLLVSQLGDLDWGPVLCGYLGALFLSAACLAICQFLGAFTQHQILAFVLSFAVLCFFMLFQYSYNNLQYRFQNFSRGILDTRDLVHYCLLVVGFLYLNARTIASTWWRS